MKCIYAFLGGALVGAAAALLMAPESGADLRNQIREILVRHGILPADKQEEIIEQIVAEIEANR